MVLLRKQTRNTDKDKLCVGPLGAPEDKFDKKMWFHIQERPTYGHDTELDKGKHPFLNFNVLSQIQIFWSSFMNPRSLLVFGSIGLVYIYFNKGIRDAGSTADFRML